MARGAANVGSARPVPGAQPLCVQHRVVAVATVPAVLIDAVQSTATAQRDGCRGRPGQ